MRVQLFSGGLDSLAIWHLMGRPTPCYVRVGAPYEAAELDTLALLQVMVPGFDPHVVQGPPVAADPAADGHVLHRNLVLLATAASATGADTLYLGALRGEASADKSARFLRAAGRALSASENRRVRVLAPAHRWTKAQLLRQLARQYPEAVPLLALTRSCYQPRGECGTCQACFRRHVALYRAGLREERPQLPPGAAGAARTNLAAASPSRWPALAVNNTSAALALAGIRMRKE